MLENHMVIGDYYPEGYFMDHDETNSVECSLCGMEHWNVDEGIDWVLWMDEEPRCRETCLTSCATCDDPVLHRGEFCELCALEAMGVEVDR